MSEKNWRNYVIGVLTAATLAVSGSCYSQAYSEIRQLEASDRAQDVKLGKLETSIDYQTKVLEEIRDELRRHP